MMDSKGFISAIVGKVAPKDDEGEEEKGEGLPEGLKAAAEDVMAALGQDYGSGSNADRGQRQAYEDKRDRLAVALKAFIEQCGGEG